MKFVILLSAIIISNISISQEIEPYSKDEINHLFWKSDQGNFDKLSAQEFLRLGASQNKGGIQYQTEKSNDKVFAWANHLSWLGTAKLDWLTPEDLKAILPYIYSTQKCLGSNTRYSSSSCLELSTVGKQACLILLHSSDRPFPDACSLISDSEWEKLIKEIEKKHKI